MAASFQIRVTFNYLGLGVAQNTFTFRDTSGITRPDATQVSVATAWINAIYAPLRAYMDTEYTLLSAVLDEVDFGPLGTVIVVRSLGALGVTVNGQQAGESTALTTAGSARADTAAPKVAGSKRFGGFTEVHLQNALWLNNILSALTAATAAWIAGPTGATGTSLYLAGVMSLAGQVFRQFVGTGSVTNVPGTQVTRKPLRGA